MKEHVTKNNDNNGKDVVLMFPGQGSQYAGMGYDFLEKNSRYHRYIETASELLGKDLQKIIKNMDPVKGLLDNTKFSQIAIFCVSSAISDYLMEDRQIDRSRIAAVTGHSLGDYSALYCSGAFDFADGARLVTYRGDLMGSYAEKVHGEMTGPDRNKSGDAGGKKMMMAAVLGLDIKKIDSVLAGYKDSVFIANYNDYTQTVISGYRKHVIEVSGELKKAGAKRVIPLKVSIASHCPLMKEASIRLKGYIEANLDDFSSIRDLSPDFFSSTRAGYVVRSEIKDTLVDQLISPVLWTRSIEKLLAGGVDLFIEVGPGKVLSGLVRRIAMAKGYRETTILSTGSAQEIENLISFLKSNNLAAC